MLARLTAVEAFERFIGRAHLGQKRFSIEGLDVLVPMLFQYRGEVIPSFALQAILLWMRVTPGEVKVDIGRSISLPDE